MSRKNEEHLADRIASALGPRPEVLEAYLFGSVARGEAGPLSDVDVAVTLDAALAPPPFPLHGAALAAEVMIALGESRVDLVVLNEAPPLLYHRVLRDGIRIRRRPPRARVGPRIESGGAESEARLRRANLRVGRHHGRGAREAARALVLREA